MPYAEIYHDTITTKNLLAQLRLVAPHIAVTTARAIEHDTLWAGLPEEDPTEKGYAPYTVTVRAKCISGGRDLEGDAYLNGYYMRPEQPALGYVNGYLPQKIEQAIESLVAHTHGLTGDLRCEAEAAILCLKIHMRAAWEEENPSNMTPRTQEALVREAQTIQAALATGSEAIPGAAERLEEIRESIVHLLEAGSPEEASARNLAELLRLGQIVVSRSPVGTAGFAETLHFAETLYSINLYGHEIEDLRLVLRKAGVSADARRVTTAANAPVAKRR